MYVRRLILAAVVACVALLGPAPQRSEASELQTKMNSLARKVADLLKDNAQTTVAIGEFTGPPDPASSSGPGIQQLLVVSLDKLGIKIDQKSELTIKGEYLSIDDDSKSEELIVRLILNIRNKKAVSKGEITEDLTFKGNGNDEMIKLLGLQVDLSDKKKATPEDRNYEIKKQKEKPPLHIDDCKIKTKEGSQFAVEVLVRGKDDTEFKPAVPKDKDGKGNAFVELKRGDVYRLRLHNGSKIESAVSVTIDGVDALQFFEPSKGRPTCFLIGASGSRDVTGWSRGTKSENEFLVGAYSDSAAAKVLKGSSKLGTITVCFHACWSGQKPPPEYDGSRSVEPNGTGLGKEVKRESKVVPKTIGPLVASITIRYNK